VTGQLSPAQLVARDGVVSERICGLLTDYLTERAASLDYSALRGLAYVLATVRSLYLNLSRWAHEDPARWIQRAVPCSIGAPRSASSDAGDNQPTTRMNNRTRSLAPLLPTLVASARHCQETTAQQLTAASAAAIGNRFTVAGHDFQRIDRSSQQRPGAHRDIRPVTAGRRRGTVILCCGHEHYALGRRRRTPP